MSDKTKTCNRCKGTGFWGETPVCHLGVPGLCVKCDGKGFQRFFTAEEVLAEQLKKAEKARADVEAEAADLKAYMAGHEAKLAARVFKSEEGRALAHRVHNRRMERAEESLAVLRKQWVSWSEGYLKRNTKSEWR